MRRSLALMGAVAVLGAAGWTLAQEAQTPSAPPPPAGETASSPASPSTSVSAADVPPEEAPPPRRARGPEPPPDEPPAPPPEPPPPLKRPRFAVAVLQGADKITAETFRFEARVGEPVRYKGVVITVRACETTAADEPRFNSFAHLEVVNQPRVGPGRPAAPARPAYRGWMFAGSPSLHPFEHPVYDLWLIACKAPEPEVSAGKA